MDGNGMMSRRGKGRWCRSPIWEDKIGEFAGGEWPGSTGVVGDGLEENGQVRNGAGGVGLNERADPVDQGLSARKNNDNGTVVRMFCLVPDQPAYRALGRNCRDKVKRA